MASEQIPTEQIPMVMGLRGIPTADYLTKEQYPSELVEASRNAELKQKNLEELRSRAKAEIKAQELNVEEAIQTYNTARQKFIEDQKKNPPKETPVPEQ